MEYITERMSISRLPERITAQRYAMESASFAVKFASSNPTPSTVKYSTTHCKKGYLNRLYIASIISETGNNIISVQVIFLNFALWVYSSLLLHVNNPTPRTVMVQHNEGMLFKQTIYSCSTCPFTLYNYCANNISIVGIFAIVL